MAKKATILIIDKEKMIVDLLVRSVSSADTTVLGATSAEEAARLIDLYGPELVVIDQYQKQPWWKRLTRK